MNIDELKQMIQAMGCTWLKVTDTSNYCKCTIDAENTREALDKLDEYIPILSGLGEIYVYGKCNKKTKDESARSYSWKVTFPGVKPVTTTGSPGGSLGFGPEFGIKELIGMATSNAQAELKAMKEHYELEKKWDEKFRKLEEKSQGLESLIPMAIPIGMQMLDMPKEQIAVAWSKVPGFSKVASPETKKAAENTATFTMPTRDEMIAYLIKNLKFAKETLAAMTDEQLQTIYIGSQSKDKSEDELANGCIELMLKMRKSNWSAKEIYTLLESAEKLGRVKEPALLIELVTRSITSPGAVDDALIFLRAKQT
jgi:hypothetical protein